MAMKATRVSVAEAKNRLPALIHEAESSQAPVEITRRGKTVAVLLSSLAYERRSQKQSVVREIRRILENDGKLVGFTDEEVASLRNRASARDVSFDED